MKKAKRGYTPKVKKRTKLSPAELKHVQDLVVPLKIAGYTRTQMSLILGVSKGQLGEIINDPKMQKRIDEVVAALPKAALVMMEAYLIEGVQAVVDVMRSSPKDEMVLKAAAELFDRAGLPKLTRAESKNDTTQANTFGQDDSSILTQFQGLPEDVQNKAADLKDMFENGLREILAEAQGQGKEKSGNT